jgi:hypothetical protein
MACMLVIGASLVSAAVLCFWLYVDCAQLHAYARAVTTGNYTEAKNLKA